MTAELELLYDVIHEFSHTLDLPIVLGQVLSLTVMALGATRGSVFMLDEEGNVIRHILARKHLPPEVQEQLIAVVMAEGAAGWVYRHRQGTVVKDTLKDERWHYFEDDLSAVRSAVVAPLLRRGEIKGVISVEHGEPEVFGEPDLQLLTAIAAQAAIAIENAWLFTQMRSERDTLTAILNSAEDAILVVDGDEQRIKMINPAAARVLDLEPDESIGRPLSEFSHLQSLARLIEQAEEDEPQEARIEIGGGLHFSVTVKDIPLVGRVAALHDITHFWELDAVKSEFVATVSHDLKAPLGTIMGYAWILTSEPTLEQEHKRYATLIVQSAERMKLLIDNLLNLARIEAGVDLAEEGCYLPAVVTKVVEQHKYLAKEKDIELTVRLPDEDLPPIMANRLRMTQAISNLVHNAIKYTPNRGEVSIEVREGTGSIVVSVNDSGVGVVAEDQSKLFRKFSRVGSEEVRSIAGTGLGLAIVRSVVESYGGRVWLESELGKGSTFFMELPYESESKE